MSFANIISIISICISLYVIYDYHRREKLCNKQIEDINNKIKHKI